MNVTHSVSSNTATFFSFYLKYTSINSGDKLNLLMNFWSFLKNEKLNVNFSMLCLIIGTKSKSMCVAGCWDFVDDTFEGMLTVNHASGMHHIWIPYCYHLYINKSLCRGRSDWLIYKINYTRDGNIPFRMGLHAVLTLAIRGSLW